MANTYTLISSVTVGAGGAATISFSSIPSTYTDLVLYTSLRSTTTGNANDRAAIVTFNGSSSNYSARRLYAYDGTTTGSDSSTGIDIYYSGTTGTINTFSNDFVYLSNYASASNKAVSVDNASEQNSSVKNWLALYAWRWADSAAITSITLTPDAGNFAQYSSAYLYGISNA
jgi:hypothetical protein